MPRTRKQYVFSLPAANSRTESRPSFVQILQAIGGCVALLYAYAFLMGWMYVSAWYAEFGLDPSFFDLSAFSYAAYSFYPWLEIYGVLLAGYTLFYAGYAVITGLQKKYRRFAEFLEMFVDMRVTFGTIILIGVAICFQLYAASLGHRRARESFKNQHVVHLVPRRANEKPGPPALDLIKASDDGRLRFVAQTKDLVIVSETNPNEPKGLKHIVFITRSDLSMVRVDVTDQSRATVK